jgi:flagellar biosynthetic protein FliR
MVTAPHGAAALCAAGVAELLVGAAIGLLVRIALGAAEALGSLVSIQMGLGFGAVVDPLTQSEGPLATLFALVAWMLLLASNGHHELLRGLADSLRALPPGAALRDGAEPLLLRMAESGAGLFQAALRIATPLAATLLGTHAALALLARVAPKVNLLMLGFLIAAGVGLVALATAGPAIGRGLLDHVLSGVARMRALAAGR